MKLEYSTIIIAVVSVIPMIMIIRKIYKKYKADTHLVELLISERYLRIKKLEQDLTHIENLLEQLDENQIKKIQKDLKKIAKELNEEDSHLVIESLEQPSYKGQKNYINKILKLTHSGALTH